MTFKTWLQGSVLLDHFRALVEVDIPRAFASPSRSSELKEKYPTYRCPDPIYSYCSNLIDSYCPAPIFRTSGMMDVIFSIIGFPFTNVEEDYKALEGSPLRNSQDRLFGIVWIPIQLLAAVVIGIVQIFSHPHQTLSEVLRTFSKNFFVRPFCSLVHSIFQLIRGILAYPLMIISVFMWMVYKIHEQEEPSGSASWSTVNTSPDDSRQSVMRPFPTAPNPSTDPRGHWPPPVAVQESMGWQDSSTIRPTVTNNGSRGIFSIPSTYSIPADPWSGLGPGRRILGDGDPPHPEDPPSYTWGFFEGSVYN